MSILSDPPPPMPLLHWIVATLLTDLVFALVFVGSLYGVMFFGDNAQSLDVLPSIAGPYLLGGLLPSLYLVSRARLRDHPTPSVWLGIVLAFVIAILMALYASYLTGENPGVYLLKIITVQFFIVMIAGALGGAAAWYYLNWAKATKKAG